MLIYCVSTKPHTNYFGDDIALSSVLLMSTSPSSTWQIGPISSPSLRWGEQRAGRIHACSTCGLILLTGELPGFCCGRNGSRFHDVTPLPPLPPLIDALTLHPDISALSRLLNLIFSFASLETTHAFPQVAGPPGFMAIQGRVYHRIRPTHTNSAIRWLLYDGFVANMPHANHASALPPTWIPAVRDALLSINPFVSALRHFSHLNAFECPRAELILHDGGNEIAAVISLNNTAHSEIRPRHLVITRVNGHTQRIPSISRLWEPLAYPLFFPHGTLGWGLVGNSNILPEGITSDGIDFCLLHISS